MKATLDNTVRRPRRRGSDRNAFFFNSFLERGNSYFLFSYLE
jgi:hypothetical protein